MSGLILPAPRVFELPKLHLPDFRERVRTFGGLVRSSKMIGGVGPNKLAGLIFVQWGDSTTTVASGSAGTVLPANSTSGHGIALCISVGGGAGDTVAAVSSSMGTFNHVISVAGGSNDLEWWACTNVSGAAKTVTVSTNLGNSWTAQATEFSGLVSRTASSGGTATGSNSAPTLSLTPAVGNAVLVGSLAGRTYSAGPSSPWTDYAAGDWELTNVQNTAYQVATSTSATASWTLNGGSASWGVAGLLLS